MERTSGKCDECGSRYIATASSMSSLCPECAHILYGTPKCPHEFISGLCAICGWDGSSSAYIQSLLWSRPSSA
ncbi:hypothetical protein CEK68_19635 [Xanthomonas sp. LMG 12461]|nr:hypothetical protein CEK68_19635 [Xanthomonas sp. LMG 12461]